MAAILEIPQYVACQKNVAYDFIKLNEKSLTVSTFCAQWMPLSAPRLSLQTVCTL